MNHLKSLRDFIAALDAIGAVQPIDVEVDWNLEIGAITRRFYELRAPAPLFNRIKDIGEGFRVLGAPGGLGQDAGTRFARIALALGYAADTPGREIIGGLAQAASCPGIPPRQVSTGPCKENVMVGKDVDLLKFPTPLIHGADGGRYIQTFGTNIVRTPDGRWTNWSVNRMMLLDRNRLTCLIPPNQHFGMIHAQWRALGKPTPIVVALGVEPGLPYVGGMSVPEGVDESHVLGAHFGEPVDVVRGEIVDLPVLATAEIVIEGHVSHEETAPEGPMGEYPGYLDTSAPKPKPVLNVGAVSYRNAAILPVVAAGPPVEEDHTGWGMPHAAMCLRDLRAAGLPVASAWMVLESACHWMLVAMAPDWHERTGMGSADLARQIGNILFATKTGFGIPKVLLVEDDFDFTDVGKTVWAFASVPIPTMARSNFAARRRTTCRSSWIPTRNSPTTPRRSSITASWPTGSRAVRGRSPPTSPMDGRPRWWPTSPPTGADMGFGPAVRPHDETPDVQACVMTSRRMIVGITGATGIVYGVRLLQVLRGLKVETHLVMTKPAEMTAAYEWPRPVKDIRALADVNYRIGDVGAAIASGSFTTMGMIVAPCSARMVAEIACGASSNLLTRAADVCLKERRRLVLMVRETPLHAGHLKAMLTATEIGAIIAPPVPAFYARPETLDDVVNHTVGRVLDLFDLESGLVCRWAGREAPSRDASADDPPES